MSIEIQNAAWELDIKPSARKFILIAYACHANQHGEAWPSVKTLTRRTGMNRKTALSHIAGLIEQGYLTDTGKKKGRTGQIPVYKINLTPTPNSTENGTVPKPEQSQKQHPTSPKPAPLNSPKTGTQNHHSFEPLEPPLQKQRGGGELIFPENLPADIRANAPTVLAELSTELANDCLKILSLKMLAGDCKSPSGLLHALAKRAAAGTLDRSGLTTPTATHASYQDWQSVKQQAGEQSESERGREAAHLKMLEKLAGRVMA